MQKIVKYGGSEKSLSLEKMGLACPALGIKAEPKASQEERRYLTIFFQQILISWFHKVWTSWHPVKFWGMSWMEYPKEGNTSNIPHLSWCCNFLAQSWKKQIWMFFLVGVFHIEPIAIEKWYMGRIDRISNMRQSFLLSLFSLTRPLTTHVGLDHSTNPSIMCSNYQHSNFYCIICCIF